MTPFCSQFNINSPLARDSAACRYYSPGDSQVPSTGGCSPTMRLRHEPANSCSYPIRQWRKCEPRLAGVGLRNLRNSFAAENDYIPWGRKFRLNFNYYFIGQSQTSRRRRPEFKLERKSGANFSFWHLQWRTEVFEMLYHCWPYIRYWFVFGLLPSAGKYFQRGAWTPYHLGGSLENRSGAIVGQIPLWPYTHTLCNRKKGKYGTWTFLKMGRARNTHRICLISQRCWYFKCQADVDCNWATNSTEQVRDYNRSNN